MDCHPGNQAEQVRREDEEEDRGPLHVGEHTVRVSARDQQQRRSSGQGDRRRLEVQDTVQGEPVSIAVVDGEVILNDSAKVVIPDIAASNGIIHVIDAVILPPIE